MTEDPIRTLDSRSESGCAVLILIDHGTITISDSESTDQAANHLRLDMENAGKLGKVLVALAAAFETDATRDGPSAATTSAHSFGLWQRGQDARRGRQDGRAISFPCSTPWHPAVVTATTPAL
jgi:hypothetical protein